MRPDSSSGALPYQSSRRENRQAWIQLLPALAAPVLLLLAGIFLNR